MEEDAKNGGNMLEEDACDAIGEGREKGFINKWKWILCFIIFGSFTLLNLNINYKYISI